MVAASVITAAVAGWLSTLASAGPWAFWASNVSAMWLLLPFIFGSVAATWARGVVWGVTMTWLCLCVFYAVVAYGLYGGHLSNVVHFGGRYVVAGTFTGAALGALGAWWRRHPTWLLPVLVGMTFAGERFAWRLRLGWTPAPTVFTVEAALGVVIAILLLWWSRRRPKTATPPALSI